jgi:hypothetical protein
MIHTKRNINDRTLFKKGSLNDRTTFSKNIFVKPSNMIRPLVIGEAEDFKEINKVYDPKNAQISFDGQLMKHSKQGSALEKR